MDSRIALQANTQLHDDGRLCFTLLKEIGRGASSIVYDATYVAGNKQRDVKHVRIKECYPIKLHIQRLASGELQAADRDAAEFQKRCEAFEEAFHFGNRLSDASVLKASLNTTVDTFHDNGTVYLVSADLADQTLATFPIADIHTCISLVKQVAFILEKIHEAGYLYLDIKPENVLIAQRETPQALLFDFDAMIPLSAVKDRSCSLGQIRMSYSKGYAPIEQQLAQLRSLGAYSDVFGLGALLYALLFGRPPCAEACERNANYTYDSMKYPKRDYQDRLFPALTAFFRKAITVCRLDRYQTMQEAYNELAVIERLADKAAPFIRSTQLPATVECIGRQAELARLSDWLKQPDSPCIFVTGMGGIGKSTLVQTFLKAHRNQIDQVLYLLFSGSLEQTLTDDTAAAINHVTSADKESLEEYYERKRSIFRELVTDTTTVLVLDNYVYDTEQDIQTLLDVGWRVIFISREAVPFKACQKTAILLDRLHDRSDLLQLFERNLGRTIPASDIPAVDHMILRVNGHTLALELIAKQLRSSHITISAAAELVDQRGFASIAPEKVPYEKDEKKAAQTIRNILTSLFQDSHLSDTKQRILKTLSLVSEQGIDIHLFQRALALEALDDVNELVHDGWLHCGQDYLTMHPVIRETVRGLHWDEGGCAYAEQLMLYLLMTIRLEADKGEYPLKLLRRMQLCEAMYQKHPKQRKKIEQSMIRRGFTGELYDKRFCRCNEDQVTDLQLSTQVVALAESVLSNVKQEPDLIGCSRLQPAYINLLFQTILHAPCHQEAFILDGTDELLLFLQGGQRQKLLVCHRAAGVYLDRNDLPNAWTLVQKARHISQHAKSCHVHAQYYDILSDYYDTQLGGAYASDEDADIRCRNKLMKATDKMIFYSKLAHQADSRLLYAKALLGKATIMIRSYDPQRDQGSERKQIERLLEKSTKMVFHEAQVFSKLYHQSYMVRAWYHSAIDVSLAKANEAMIYAQAIALRVFPTTIDLIDSSLMPCANIYCNMGDFEQAEALLLIAVNMCEQRPAVLPDKREKMKLYGCLLDVYREWGKYELFKSTIDKIDSENENNRPFGIFMELSDEERAFSQNPCTGLD